MGRLLAPDTLFDAALAVAGAAIAVVSWGYGFGTLARPGPGLYPFFVGLAITLFAAAAFFGDVREPEAAGAALDRTARRRLAAIGALFASWIVAMPLLGYALVTLVTTYALAKTLNLEGHAKPLAVAGGTALFIYVLFEHLLYIDLPRGLLGGG
jgi:putative tricarboxylic transport membrane protein